MSDDDTTKPIETIKILLFNDPIGGVRVDVVARNPKLAIFAMLNGMLTLLDKLEPKPDEPTRIIM